ncbi:MULTISPECIES: hypothetical protein [Pasteurellaceae]|uniref:Uncharacterized protein n=1 Tax=Avibacterium paragallinarum TaxID=728 RepID=A0ABU7QJC5_AVIPA|nr:MULTISPECIES: hypothetical protein [Pasteurellaceae]QCA34446.1 hypothetical protein E5134_10715 [Pasteurella multocida]QZP16603.1 hypothetical protein K5O18_04665 [Avibacterium paragallinarum]WAL55886.1 hypothetical protein OY678_07705 [Avibacterium paragallinarum]WAM59904.1 hypothetical protein OW731_02950 [Avibacterium paragallinarum]HDX0997836.1 hypothetical protein [Pasteurella multocida]
MYLENFSNIEIEQNCSDMITQSMDYNCAIIGLIPEDFEYQVAMICAEFGYKTIKCGNIERHFVLLFDVSNDPDFIENAEKLSLLFTQKDAIFIPYSSSNTKIRSFYQYSLDYVKKFLAQRNIKDFTIEYCVEIRKYQPDHYLGKYAKSVVMKKIVEQISQLQITKE